MPRIYFFLKKINYFLIRKTVSLRNEKEEEVYRGIENLFSMSSGRLTVKGGGERQAKPENRSGEKLV